MADAASTLLAGGFVPTDRGLVQADVLVVDGLIAAIGPNADRPDVPHVRVDGQIVLPGFIDAHVHGDLLLLEERCHEPALRQGVTTYVLGQDGTSVVPGRAETRAAMVRYFAGVNGPFARSTPEDVAQLLEAYDGASTVNAAYLVPNGNLRLDEVGPTPVPASTAQLSRMQDALARALEQGAAGLSTGLDYVPSRYASAAELTELCKVVAAHGKTYVTHMRGYGANVETGMQEVCEIALRSGVRVHVSHFSGRAEEVLEPIARAIALGVDLTFDTYPYVPSSSILHMYALPPDVVGGGVDALIDALEDEAKRRSLAKLAGARLDAAPAMTLAAAPGTKWDWAEGRDLAELATEVGLGPGELVVAILRDTGLRASVVLHRKTFNEEDVAAVQRHPAHMASSDGIFVGSNPHPRGWASFAMLLRQQLDGATGWTWSEAVEHLSGAAAKRFGLGHRGRLAEGYVADVVVIDPATVAAQATFASPRKLAVGITHVMLGGVFALRDGLPTSTTPGCGLRS